MELDPIQIEAGVTIGIGMRRHAFMRLVDAMIINHCFNSIDQHVGLALSRIFLRRNSGRKRSFATLRMT